MTHPVSATVIKNPTWWRRRTHLERILTLVTAFITLLCILLVGALALTSYRQQLDSGSFVQELAATHPVQQAFELLSAQDCYHTESSDMPDTAPMDPVLRLPPELLQYIWDYLDRPDLLHALQVSSTWCTFLKEDPVWRKFCKKKTIKPHPWSLFLKEQKLEYCWRNGIYKEYAMEASFEQVCLSKRNIFLAQDKKLRCYSPTMKKISCLTFSDRVHKLFNFDNYICVVFKNIEKNTYKLSIIKEMSVVGNLEATSDNIVTCRNRMCFRNGSNLYIWDSRGEFEEFNLPWDITDFHLYNEKIVVKRRCNFGFIISISIDNENWKNIYELRSETPLGYTNIFLKSDPKGVAIIDVFYGDDYYNYSELAIFGTDIVYEMGSSKKQYFRCCFTDNSIVFTDNGGHLINLNLSDGKKLCQRKLNSPIDSIHSIGSNFIVSFQDGWEFWNGSGSRYFVKKGFPSATTGIGDNFVFAMTGRTINVWTFGEENHE